MTFGAADERITNVGNDLEKYHMKSQHRTKSLCVRGILAGMCAASTMGAAEPKAAPDASADVKHPTSTRAVPERTDPNVELRLTPRFASAPGYLQSTIRVKPHPDNRVMRIVVDSERYYRSSDIALEGAGSARTHFMTWNALPEGVYKVTVTVYGTDGLRGQQSMPFEVRGLQTAR